MAARTRRFHALLADGMALRAIGCHLEGDTREHDTPNVAARAH